MVAIPAFDLTRQYQRIKTELDAAVTQVMSSGHFILGEHVRALEEEIAELCGVRHAIGVANGSDALHLALAAAGIGVGDEVIVPAFTFFATAGAVARTGAVPVFIDVDPVSFNLDPLGLARAVTARTKAIIPVHLFGNPADMDAILAVAETHGLVVIEDCAQAIGASYKGRRIGSFGTLATLSFFPTKNLGAFGDGGMVLTDDPILAERVRMLRAHGAQAKYYHEELGYNSRLDEMQAAVLRVKLRYLQGWTEARRRVADTYNLLLGPLGLKLPISTAGAYHVYHQFTIQIEPREELMEYLRQRGIGCSVYYPLGLHRQPVFANLPSAGASLTVTEALTSKVLSLPMFPEMTPEEVGTVCKIVTEWQKTRILV